jgi:methyl-accepting chemotaxis protein
MSNDQDANNNSRMKFMGIDTETRHRLLEFWKIVHQHLPDILSGFYSHVAAEPTLAKIVGDETPRLKRAQERHWEQLFSGRFDDAYFISVKTIGFVHNKIGLEPRWYIGGYNYVLCRLTDLATEAYRWSPGKSRATIRAINSAVMLDMDIAISTYQEAMLADRAARGLKLDALLKAFDSDAQLMLGSVTAAATQLQSTAEGMLSIASKTRGQTATVASASEEASTNVHTVAAAAEELSRSVIEISHQVAQSSKIANVAVLEAQRTNEIVKELVESAEKISAIVLLVQTIAAQTNLLALNATIEAARAGDAGKGFAVVACEVKDLASQTAKATEEIGLQASQIQAATKQAGAAIQSIARTIEEISQTSSIIASSVQEQGDATNEIARSVQEAATGTQEVSAHILGVSLAADHTGDAASEVLGAAESLSKQSAQLSDNVSNFIRMAKAI